MTEEQEEDDPFHCFGSDSDSQAEDPISSHAQKRVKQANLRSLMAAEAITRLPFVSPEDYEVVHITPESGQGMRARRAYACGDEILRESAVLRVNNHQAATSYEEAQALHRRALQQAFDGLEPLTQRAVMDLSYSSGGTTGSASDRLARVYQTNSFQLTGVDDHAQGGLFLTIARINHSCRPNANHYWREDLQQTLVLATREIAVGEEICTTYGPSHCLDAAGRRSYLKERFDFDCHCNMCDEGNRYGGDDRMVELSSLQDSIPVLAAEGKPREAIASIEKCLDLLEQQGFGRTSGAFVKTLLHQGYQICSGDDLQDWSRAKAFLSEELVAVQHGQGIGSPNAVEIQHQLDCIMVE